MTQQSKSHNLRKLLLPVSLLYGMVIAIRHKLFDWKIFSSTSFNIPVICVGNLTVGGTGKTPHIEYLIELLKDNVSIAMLSRGYKRKTKGYLLASKKTSPEEIGDEPFQIYRKYSDIRVAVCEKRVQGIYNLLDDKKKIQTILLDDAFQHRHVEPGMNILLIDYNRPIFNDRLLPAGNLRDLKSQMKRADIVIVSKTPKDITGIDKRLWIKQLNLYPYQKLFFSTIKYKNVVSVFNKKDPEFNLSKIKTDHGKVLLLTGIASPKPLEDYILSKGLELEKMAFPDHHNFSPNDIKSIKEKFDSIAGKKKIILTTEKDAVRLKQLKNFPKSLKDKIYYLPIKIEFLDKGNKDFDKIISNYVRKNKKIGGLHS